MGIRIYRLTTSATAATVGVAATTVVASGTIVGCAFVSGVVGPGAGTGSIATEVALNNTALSNATTPSGAPSEQLVARSMVTYGANASPNEASFVPLKIPVRQGNTLCLNLSATGTAPSVHYGCFDVQVME